MPTTQAPEPTNQIPDTAFVRRYRPQDAQAVAGICLRTGDAGGDATGKYRDEAILNDLFAAPYAQLDPRLAFVLDDGTGEAVGYILGPTTPRVSRNASATNGSRASPSATRPRRRGLRRGRTS